MLYGQNLGNTIFSISPKKSYLSFTNVVLTLQLESLQCIISKHNLN